MRLSRRSFGRSFGAAATGALAGQFFPGRASAQASNGVLSTNGSRESLCDLGAFELAARIRRKEVSARDAMTAHLARIERINPQVNAIVTLRRGSSGGLRSGTDCGRQRHRGLAAQSAGILQRGRAASLARTGAGEGGSWVPLPVPGPIGRSVRDVALMLSAIAGPDPRSPLALAEDGARFRAPLDRNFKGARVAWWKGLGGIPFEPEIRSAVDANRRVFEALGCLVEEAEPDFTDVGDAFRVLRYTANHAQYSALIRQRPEWVKDEIKFEVAQAERYTGADVSRALARQARMHDQSRQFFERYDYFVLPVTQVAPFDVTTRYPTQVAGVAMQDYIDWMRSCWYITLMANPAISVPGGFTPSGLPVGLQIVGRHRDELSVLQLAHAFEQATRHGARRPALLSA